MSSASLTTLNGHSSSAQKRGWDRVSDQDLSKRLAQKQKPNPISEVNPVNPALLELRKKIQATGELSTQDIWCIQPFWKVEQLSFLLEKVERLTAFIHDDVGTTLSENTLQDVLSKYHKNLKTVAFVGCTELSPSFFEQFAKTCPQVEDLDLRWSKQIDHRIIQTVSSLVLRKLNLNSCPDVDDECLKTIAHQIPSIQDLNLDRCEKITDRGVEFLAQGATNLRALDLTACEITDQGVKRLAYLTSLTSLNFGFSHKITDRGITAIAQTLKLTSLKMEACWSITNESLRVISIHMSMLEVLNIDNCNELTEEGIKFTSEGNKCLYKISMNQCEKLYMPSCFYYLEIGLPNLKFLSIRGNDVDFKEVALLTQSFRQLEVLNIAYIEGPYLSPALLNMARKAIETLVNNSSTLKTIYVGRLAQFFNKTGDPLLALCKTKEIEMI